MIVIVLVAVAIVLISAGNKKVRSSSRSSNKKSLPGNLNLFSSNPGRAKTTVTKSNSSSSSVNTSKKKKMKPHFRWNYSNQHPAYIYDQTISDYKYIGTTHASRTHGRKNIPFTVNPDPTDNKKRYMRDFSTHDNKKNFSKKKISYFKVDSIDKSKIEKVKGNYRDKPPDGSL